MTYKLIFDLLLVNNLLGFFKYSIKKFKIFHNLAKTAKLTVTNCVKRARGFDPVIKFNDVEGTRPNFDPNTETRSGREELTHAIFVDFFFTNSSKFHNEVVFRLQ